MNAAPKVLVIDDEPAIRFLYRVNLEAEGIEVLEAEDGLTGVELARLHAPDVILLDVTLPGLDGWGVVEAVRADRSHTTAIAFVTGHAETVERAQELGIEVVLKPFDPMELAPLVRRLAGQA